jgi:hypothetical protein
MKSVRPYPRDGQSARSTIGQRARSLENNIFAITATFHNSAGHFETERTARRCVVRDQETTDLDTALACARTYIADPSRLNLLSMYERRIHGNMTRSLRQLTDLQAQRRQSEAEAKKAEEQARAKALEEETLLFQLNELEREQNGQASSPQSDSNEETLMVSGFVFSIAEIRRNLRLAAARRLPITPQSRPIRKAA